MIKGGGIVAVVPVFNEEAALGDVIRGVRDCGLPVIVVDDCSEDATVDVARRAEATLLSLPMRLGAWGAMQAGMRHALRNGAEYVVTLDGDGQHCPQDIALLTAAAREGEADVVIGACPQRGSFARQVAWTFFRLLTGLEWRDLTSGFRLYNRRAMRLLLRREGLLSDFQDVGILLLLRRNGLKVCEVPVAMSPRRVGKSHIFSSWWRVGYYMFYTFIIACSKR